MITRSYDALVVHPSPGALIAAAMLARDGMSVVVLEDEPTNLGAGSFRLQRHAPPITGFGEGMLVSRTLRTLKFHPHETVKKILLLKHMFPPSGLGPGPPGTAAFCPRRSSPSGVYCQSVD